MEQVLAQNQVWQRWNKPDQIELSAGTRLVARSIGCEQRNQDTLVAAIEYNYEKNARNCCTSTSPGTRQPSSRPVWVRSDSVRHNPMPADLPKRSMPRHEPDLRSFERCSERETIWNELPVRTFTGSAGATVLVGSNGVNAPLSEVHFCGIGLRLNCIASDQELNNLTFTKTSL